MITTKYKGANLPQFVPCLGGRCPERMQLEGFVEFSETGDDSRLQYRCMRRKGYKGYRTGEVYEAECYYHEHPYPARDYAYWHRDPDEERGKHKDTDREDTWHTTL